MDGIFCFIIFYIIAWFIKNINTLSNKLFLSSVHSILFIVILYKCSLFLFYLFNILISNAPSSIFPSTSCSEIKSIYNLISSTIVSFLLLKFIRNIYSFCPRVNQISSIKLYYISSRSLMQCHFTNLLRYYSPIYFLLYKCAEE